MWITFAEYFLQINFISLDALSRNSEQIHLSEFLKRNKNLTFLKNTWCSIGSIPNIIWHWSVTSRDLVRKIFIKTRVTCSKIADLNVHKQIDFFFLWMKSRVDQFLNEYLRIFYENCYNLRLLTNFKNDSLEFSNCAGNGLYNISASTSSIGHTPVWVDRFKFSWAYRWTTVPWDEGLCAVQPRHLGCSGADVIPRQSDVSRVGPCQSAVPHPRAISDPETLRHCKTLRQSNTCCVNTASFDNCGSAYIGNEFRGLDELTLIMLLNGNAWRHWLNSNHYFQTIIVLECYFYGIVQSATELFMHLILAWYTTLFYLISLVNFS